MLLLLVILVVDLEYNASLDCQYHLDDGIGVSEGIESDGHQTSEALSNIVDLIHRSTHPELIVYQKVLGNPMRWFKHFYFLS